MMRLTPATAAELSDETLLVAYERASMDPSGVEALAIRAEIERRGLTL